MENKLVCPNCGTELPAESHECYNCGTRFDKIGAPTPENPIEGGGAVGEELVSGHLEEGASEGNNPEGVPMDTSDESVEIPVRVESPIAG